MNGMRILGIDPGSRLTGFGCIEIQGPKLVYIHSGAIQLTKDNPTFEVRLRRLYEELTNLITTLKPTVLSIEKIFFAKNVMSALKLGHARGVILLAGAMHDLVIEEYNPTEVKHSLIGNGHADKELIQKMVKLYTGNREFESLDASDALALAICHAQTMQSPLKRIAKSAKTKDHDRIS